MDTMIRRMVRSIFGRGISDIITSDASIHMSWKQNKYHFVWTSIIKDIGLYDIFVGMLKFVDRKSVQIKIFEKEWMKTLFTSTLFQSIKSRKL